MSRAIIETSIFLNLLQRFYKIFYFLNQRLNDPIKNSRIYKLWSAVYNGIMIGSKYSFFTRVTEIKQPGATIPVLDNSWFLRSLLGFYKARKNSTMYYLSRSSLIKSGRDSVENLYFSPAKQISAAIIIAVLTNIILSFICQTAISRWGWLLRGLFLVAGCIGLFCKVDWPTVKESSKFLGK